MKATVDRKALLEVLGDLKTAVSGRCLIPICENLLLRVGKGRLTVTANNLEVSLTGSCEANIAKVGAICAPPKPLETFLKAVDTEQVTLSVVGKGRLRAEANSAAITLDGAEAEDFPPTPQVKGKGVEITGLAEALAKVDYAMASKDTRPVLSGICLTLIKGKVELTAADGFRMAITSAKVSGKLQRQAVIPAGAVKLLGRLMADKVTVRDNGKDIAFEGSGLVMVVRPVDGSYPNYWQLVPRKGTALKADAEELRKALKVVTAIKPDRDIVRLQTKGKVLTLSAKNDGGGETEVSVAAQGKVKTAFNACYLRDLLARVDGQVTLRTESPSSPGVVKHQGTTHVLMPLFVQW